jgi:DNA polymerase (family X)
MHFGVSTAQRGWTGADEVINTWPLEKLLKFFEKKD